MQAVWCKIQELGMQIAYIRKTSTYDICHRLMALLFPPAAYIPSLFGTIKAIDQPEPLSQLLTYFKRQSMTNSIFPITSWPIFSSKFGLITMSKDGWSDAKSQQYLNLYKLIHVLYKEATYIQVQLITNGVVSRIWSPKI